YSWLDRNHFEPNSPEPAGPKHREAFGRLVTCCRSFSPSPSIVLDPSTIHPALSRRREGLDTPPKLRTTGLPRRQNDPDGDRAIPNCDWHKGIPFRPFPQREPNDRSCQNRFLCSRLKANRKWQW